MKKQKKNRIETALHLIASLRSLISGTQTKCKENHKKCTCETKLPLSLLSFRQKLAMEVDEFLTGGKLNGKFMLGPSIMLMTVGDAFRMIKRVCDHVSLVAVFDGVNEINKTQELMQMMEQNEHHIPTLSDCNGCCYFGAGVRPEHCSGCYKFGNERPTKFVETINFVSTDSNVGFTTRTEPYLTAPVFGENNFMSDNENLEVPKPQRKLNHERFGKDQGELARACWYSETNQCIAFELWLYSYYEPNSYYEPTE